MTKKQKMKIIRKIQQDFSSIDFYGNFRLETIFDDEMIFYSDVYDRYMGIRIHVKNDNYEPPIMT